MRSRRLTLASHPARVLSHCGRGFSDAAIRGLAPVCVSLANLNATTQVLVNGRPNLFVLLSICELDTNDTHSSM
jgi:hypothetical protein